MSSTASEFVKKHSGGGRAYLSAAMLTEGLTGTISEPPYVENVTFGNEPEKEVFRIPIDLDSTVTVNAKKGKVERSDMLWSPGVNAVGFLLEQLGEKDWSGTKGHFEQRTIGSWAPWFFVPSDAKSPPKTQAKAKGKTEEKSSATFKCGMCPQSFPTSKLLRAHIEAAHS